MDLSETRQLGAALMAEHGLSGWLLDFDDAKVRAGVCRFSRRAISLSRPLTMLYTAEQVRETILHEIAHALVGPRHGHDDTWRAVAQRIGSTGERCVAPEAPRTPAPWLGTCPAGHTVTRHRQPSRPGSCTRCRPGFDPDALFTWLFHGREVPMSAAYQKAMRQLRQSTPLPLPGLLGVATTGTTAAPGVRAPSGAGAR
ncbi:SprT-like domain-containing protein [Georgenia faecalis]|uniref:SprT-like domain-containing protein n=1 Tax=Georgenia faecalis TaxID=2483799 RepID=UPI000FD9919A|nr:SprT-like domain-containing protein [Georgenia faecalis]